MKKALARLAAHWRARLVSWGLVRDRGDAPGSAGIRGSGEHPATDDSSSPRSVPPPASPPLDPAERDRRAVITLVVLTAIAHVGLTGGRIAVTLGGIELGASAFTAGLLISFFSLLPMFLSVATGRLVDRIGPMKPLAWGLILMALGTAAPLISWEVGTLFFCSTMVGLGYMSFNTGTQKLAGEIGGAEARRLNFSLMSIGFSVSAFFGPIITGVMIDAAGYRATFGLLLLSPLITLLGLRWLELEPKYLQPVARVLQGPQQDSVMDLLRDPEMRKIYLVVTMISAAWDIHQFVVPIYGKEIGLSASVIGSLLGAYALATFLVRLAMPLFARRLAEWTLIIGSLVIGCVSYLLYPLSTFLPVMLALSFTLGIGLGSSQPLIMSLIHRHAPPERVGEAVGLRMMLVHCTQAFLPGAFGAVGGLIGIGPLFWGMGLLLGGTVIYVRRGPRPGESR
jgi:MFS family permease